MEVSFLSRDVHALMGGCQYNVFLIKRKELNIMNIFKIAVVKHVKASLRRRSVNYSCICFSVNLCEQCDRAHSHPDDGGGHIKYHLPTAYRYLPHTGTYRISVPTAYQYLPHTSTYCIPVLTAYQYLPHTGYYRI